MARLDRLSILVGLGQQRMFRDRPRYSGDSDPSRQKSIVPFLALSAMGGMGYSS